MMQVLIKTFSCVELFSPRGKHYQIESFVDTLVGPKKILLSVSSFIRREVYAEKTKFSFAKIDYNWCFSEFYSIRKPSFSSVPRENKVIRIMKRRKPSYFGFITIVFRQRNIS